MNEKLNNNIKTLFLITIVVDDRKSVLCGIKMADVEKKPTMECLLVAAVLSIGTKV